MAQQKVVVITGATRGLGRALVDRFVEVGWIVAGCGRDGQRIGELQKRYAGPHRFDVVDVTDVTDVTGVERWAETLGGAGLVPDLLLNNAAVINRNAALWEVPVEDFRRTVEVNIVGVYLVIRSFVPRMIEAGRGVVVNFSSAWGRSTSPEVAPYCATKFAIEGLTSAMAAELPEGLAAVALNPGIIDTDMLRSCWSEGAGAYPDPVRWSAKAAPFLMRLGAKDNGRSLDAPSG